MPHSSRSRYSVKWCLHVKFSAFVSSLSATTACIKIPFFRSYIVPMKFMFGLSTESFQSPSNSQKLLCFLSATATAGHVAVIGDKKCGRFRVGHYWVLMQSAVHRTLNVLVWNNDRAMIWRNRGNLSEHMYIHSNDATNKLHCRTAWTHSVSGSTVSYIHTYMYI